METYAKNIEVKPEEPRYGAIKVKLVDDVLDFMKNIMTYDVLARTGYDPAGQKPDAN